VKTERKELFRLLKNVSQVDLSFENELRRECKYHLNGGTEYRQQTAKLSLEVALETREVKLFLDPVKAKEKVIEFFPHLDKHRQDDVSKMLRVIAKGMYLKQATPNEVREYSERKIKNKVELIRKKDSS